MARRSRPVLMAVSVAVLAACAPIALPIARTPVVQGAGISSRSFAGDARVVRLTVTGKAEVTRLAEKGFEPWEQEGNAVIGEMPETLITEFGRQGRKLTFIPFKGLSRSTFDKGYHTYETTKATLAALAANHPAIARLHDVGDGWEKTQGKADRDIWALQITSQRTRRAKPSLLFMGNHHGRELASVEVPLLFAQHLIENYGKDANVTRWVDTRDIWIVPMVNPDGHARAEQGFSWRKNANTSNGGGNSAPNGFGIDLNRNYGYEWGGGGASPQPSAATYRGPKALSEPETQAVQRLMASRKWTFSVSYHSFSNEVIWPWSYSDNPAPDARLLSAIGTKMANLAGYTAQQSSGMYIAAGDSDDMAYGVYKILPFTVEIGTYNDGFDPPYSKVRQFFNENRPGAEYLLEIADDPSVALKP